MQADSHDSERVDQLARRLGASRVVKVGHHSVLSPPELLGLAEVIRTRIRSTGGRPTDPDLTTKRLVGFKPETWQRLQDAAQELGREGVSVAPSQLAAILIERSLNESDRAS
ncbi:MAG: hypothetical protein ACT4P1_10615 [Sporichthyaceae bacterium]